MDSGVLLFYVNGISDAEFFRFYESFNFVYLCIMIITRVSLRGAVLTQLTTQNVKLTLSF